MQMSTKKFHFFNFTKNTKAEANFSPCFSIAYFISIMYYCGCFLIPKNILKIEPKNLGLFTTTTFILSPPNSGFW